MFLRGKIFFVLSLAFLLPVYSHADPKITLKPGKFEIEGDGVKIRVGGRMQADMAFYDPSPSRVQAAPGASSDRQDTVDDINGLLDGFGDGAELRRARLFVSGALWGTWKFKAQYDFADGTDHIRDAYLRYTGAPAHVTVGHFKAPFSLEGMTSSKHVTFTERALPNVFAAGRGLGVGLSYANAGMTLAAAATDELDEGGAGVADGDDVIDLTGRVTYDFLHGGKDRVGHFGVAVNRRDFGDAGSFRLRQRSETHVTGTRLVSTGRMNDPDSMLTWGVEAAWVQGPLSVQGEYMKADFEADGGDRDFDGYYIEGSWFLTGEHRRYKAGEFKAPKPNSIVGKGGRGAWQVALRYSSLDLSDKNLASTSTAGELDNITVGVNWWPAPNIRFAANYVMSEADYPTVAADDQYPDLEVDVFQLRAQIEF